MIKKLILASLTCSFLALPPLLWFAISGPNAPHEPAHTLEQYLKLTYARDFRSAYRLIATEDQRLKRSSEYESERGPFTGFALEVARKLAGLIEIRPLASERVGSNQRVAIAMKLPDANSVAPILLDWDEKKLNALSPLERKKIVTAIDDLIGAKKLPMIEGDEQFVLVKEGSKWKIFLDWAAGAQVRFATALPAQGGVAAEALTKETVARSGDLFTVGFKVANPMTKEIVTRIVHRVEPKELAEYLDLVECALLLPVRIRPGEEQIFHSTYVVRGDLPEGTKSLNVTYEFKIENR
jgi:hypothetical protein